MSTYIHFGNNQAISDGQVLEGDLITEVIFPDGLTSQQEIPIALAALSAHQGYGTPTAVFVSSNDEILEGLLAQALGIVDNVIPPGYGDGISLASLQMPFKGSRTK